MKRGTNNHRRVRRRGRRTHGGNVLSNMAVPAGLLLLQRALSAKKRPHSRKSRKTYRRSR